MILTADLSTLAIGFTPRRAYLTISSPSIAIADSGELYAGGTVKVPFDDDGRISIELLDTDTTGTDPVTWQYRLQVRWLGGSLPAFSCELTEDIDLADVQPMNPADPVYIPQEIDQERVVGLTEALDEKADQTAVDTLSGVLDQYVDTTVEELENKVTISPEGRDQLALTDYDKLRPFFADMANHRNKRVDIAFLGDSNPEGFALTAWEHTSPAQLAAMLRARYGITTGARGFVGIQHDKVNKPFWPHVYTGGTISFTGYGANARQIGLFSTGQKFVHTVATPLTSFYIHYSAYSTGVMYYKIDGGSNVNVTVSGTASIVPTRVLVSAPVTSTIEIGWVSGQAYPCGIQENKGDENSGLQVHNLGWSSTSAKTWNDRTVATWRQAQAVLAPQLIVVNLGGNDSVIANGNRTAAQFQADLTTLLGHLGTSVSTTAPIVVNMQWNLGDSYMVEPWANYVAAAKAVCSENPRAVCIDHSARMYASNVTDTLGLYNAASLPHAAAKGYALYAATIAEALRPR